MQCPLCHQCIDVDPHSIEHACVVWRMDKLPQAPGRRQTALLWFHFSHYASAGCRGLRVADGLDQINARYRCGACGQQFVTRDHRTAAYWAARHVMALDGLSPLEHQMVGLLSGD